MRKRKNSFRGPETFRLGERMLEASRGIKTLTAMEVRHQASYKNKGLEKYAVSPDGVVHPVNSHEDVVFLARAYRDYLR